MTRCSRVLTLHRQCSRVVQPCPVGVNKNCSIRSMRRRARSRRRRAAADAGSAQQDAGSAQQAAGGPEEAEKADEEKKEADECPPRELDLEKAAPKVAYSHVKTPDEVDDLPEHEVVNPDESMLEG